MATTTDESKNTVIETSAPMPTPPAPPRGIQRFLPSVALVSCSAGIIGFLLIYAVLQEKIMTKEYGYEDEKPVFFRNSLFLVLNNRLAAALCAVVVLVIQGEFSQLKNTAPLYKYFLVSISNVLATACQYEALKWVTLPTQTLAKCAKMVPVMIWGTLIDKKKYGVTDFLVALCVTIGCTVFLVSGNIKAKQASEADSKYGLVLMMGYLLFDGFTSTFQEKLFGGYKMTIYNQMLYVNICSGLMSLVFLILSGKLMSSLAFSVKYPRLLVDATVLSFSAVGGQFSITYTIKNFGALVYATIMTIRQFLVVLISNIINEHHITQLQWLGAITVFGSLLYKSYSKSKKKTEIKNYAEDQQPAQS